MHPEVDELRPKLKEILYDCAVEIRATKAALFLFDGTSRFELVTEYGFRGGVREAADVNDPIVDRCGRGRTPFYVNGVGTEPRFSQILWEASTDRLLAAPLYTRGKLIGLIDMRDKAGKLPFDNADIPKAQSIADRIVGIVAEKPIFGHRFIQLSKLSGPHQSVSVPASDAAAAAASAVSAESPVRDHPFQPAAPNSAPPPPSQPVPQAQPHETRSHVPHLAAVVLEARAMSSSIFSDSASGVASEVLSDRELTAARDVLRSILLIPGTVAATFSAFGHLGGVQEIAARSTLTEEAKNLIQSKLNVWLTKRGDGGGFVRTSASTPFGTSGPPVTQADIQKVFTAPLTVGSLRGLYLTVVFAATPDRTAHELLAVLHNHLQIVLEQSMHRGAMAGVHTSIAEKLVEPDFTKYPELRRHSDLVSRLCESFGRHIALPQSEIETARVAGMVHDCGMRLLDYDRLYRKRDLTTEELGFLREHPAVGAALVEPLLGSEIARIVLCHHERVDGRGYPNELHGEEIPMLSRFIQVCEAWVAMTDADTYQPPESRDAALGNLSRAAGSQFDAELTGRFIEMIRASR